jgi:hypothetical protein
MLCKGDPFIANVSNAHAFALKRIDKVLPQQHIGSPPIRTLAQEWLSIPFLA